MPSSRDGAHRFQDTLKIWAVVYVARPVELRLQRQSFPIALEHLPAALAVVFD